ncbi:MAG: Stk1 family PASTA domain-containing Ser/Thr kinase [Actinomycetota bacterium]|nr:Stk1 family PASTA domain-containing Ser/Thr kinase [Actinomycetota bacterium]
MIGKTLGGRYFLEQLIGSGGMADVYRAKDNLLGRTVAVKVLHPQFAKDSVFIERFRQEAQAAANLNQPNIVNVYDWGNEDDTYFIVMEYVEGRDLKRIINEGGAILPERAVEIAIAITHALEAAHSHGIVHRDIKPQNIILTVDNTIKVMDFGIARQTGSSAMTQTGTILGTAQYISPEQAQGYTADPRSDLYSLGIVLYEMLTGKAPFDGDSPVAIAYKHVREDPLPPSMINPDVSPELEAVIMKALAKNPENRYQNAPELRADLERLLEGAPVAATPVLRPGERAAQETRAFEIPSGAPQKKRRGLLWTIVILLILLGIGAAIYALVNGTKGIVVPNLVGQTEQQAKETLEEKGLELSVVKRVIDIQKPSGVIISQDPTAGEKIQKGERVEVVVSKGTEQATVPDCRGLSQSEAAARLESAGLRIGNVTYDYNQTIAKDKVCSQNPEPGAKAAKGSEVDLVISKGPEMSMVPSVVGLDMETAKSKIEEAGFTAEIKEVTSETEREGTVIEQQPAANERAPKGSKVVISVVKKAEKVPVPNVMGMDRNTAVSTLTSAGFEVTVADKQVSNQSDVGKVLDMSPGAGTLANKGDRITIYVGVASSV